MNPEYLIERKKLKRELINWKIIAILLIAIFMTVGLRFATKDVFSTNSSIKNGYIASVYIDGAIKNDRQIQESLTEIIDDQNIKALILHVNSPGGSASASENFYGILREIAQQKPIACVMNDYAASGGYMIALAADYIVAHNSTITGSIGVYVESLDLTGLAEKLGVTSNMFRSGPLKGAPNSLEKVTPEVADATMSMIHDIYNYFVDLVVERRGLAKPYVKQLADGRAYTGRQALDLKLIDCIGSEAEALKWLQEVKKVDKSLKVIEFELKPKTLMQKLLGSDYIEQKIHAFFTQAKFML